MALSKEDRARLQEVQCEILLSYMALGVERSLLNIREVTRKGKFSSEELKYLLRNISSKGKIESSAVGIRNYFVRCQRKLTPAEVSRALQAHDNGRISEDFKGAVTALARHLIQHLGSSEVEEPPWWQSMLGVDLSQLGLPGEPEEAAEVLRVSLNDKEEMLSSFPWKKTPPGFEFWAELALSKNARRFTSQIEEVVTSLSGKSGDKHVKYKKAYGDGITVSSSLEQFNAATIAQEYIVGDNITTEAVRGAPATVDEYRDAIRALGAQPMYQLREPVPVPQPAIGPQQPVDDDF